MIEIIPTVVLTGFANDLKDVRIFIDPMNIRMRNQRPKMLGKITLSGNRQTLVTKKQNQKFIERRLDIFQLGRFKILGKIDTGHDGSQSAANRCNFKTAVSLGDGHLSS